MNSLVELSWAQSRYLSADEKRETKSESESGTDHLARVGQIRESLPARIFVVSTSSYSLRSLFIPPPPPPPKERTFETSSNVCWVR